MLLKWPMQPRANTSTGDAAEAKDHLDEYAAYSVAEISAGVIRVISKGQQERRLHDPGDQMHLVIESAKKWQHERWPKR